VVTEGVLKTTVDNAGFAVASNYLPLTGGNITGNLNVSANVGIGTTSPTTPLHITTASVGDQRVLFNGTQTTTNPTFTARNSSSQDVSIGVFGSATTNYGVLLQNQGFLYTNSGGLNLSADNASGVIRFGTGINGGTERMRIASDGNVGIGTANPISKLEVAGTISANGKNLLTSDGTSNYIFTQANLYIQSASGGSTLGIITSTGNVGIGTTSPDHKLTISGGLLQINDTAGSTTTGKFGVYSFGGIFEINPRTSTGGFSLVGLAMNSSGDVGIGTTTPTDKLHVVNNTADKGITLERTSSTTGKYTFAIKSNGNFEIGESGVSTRLLIEKTTGNVGIGTTTIYKNGLNVVSGGSGQIAFRHANQTGSRHWYIGVEGSNDVVNFYADNSQGVYMSRGDTAWSASSDERLKTDLIPITNALSKLNTLRTVTGRYKKDEVGKSRSFLLAQDVLKVFPEAVDIKNDEDKTLGLRYSELVPLLIKGIQELLKRVEELESK
jgi:hypothetical protein